MGGQQPRIVGLLDEPRSERPSIRRRAQNHIEVGPVCFGKKSARLSPSLRGRRLASTNVRTYERSRVIS
jgi:hypothetical protein